MAATSLCKDSTQDGVTSFEQQARLFTFVVIYHVSQRHDISFQRYLLCIFKAVSPHHKLVNWDICMYTKKSNFGFMNINFSLPRSRRDRRGWEAGHWSHHVSGENKPGDSKPVMMDKDLYIWCKYTRIMYLNWQCFSAVSWNDLSPSFLPHFSNDSSRWMFQP